MAKWFILVSLQQSYACRLQAILHAAMRLIQDIAKFTHISSPFSDFLHRLPIRQRIEFRVCLLMQNWLCSVLFAGAIAVFSLPNHPPLWTSSRIRVLPW